LSYLKAKESPTDALVMQAADESVQAEPLNPGGASIPLLGRYEASHWARYEFASQFYRPGMYVDFGCGYGFGTSLVARSRQGQAVGLDIDGKSVAYASAHFGDNNLTFRLIAEPVIPAADGSVGLLTAFEVVEHLYPRQLSKFMTEARRVLAPRAALVGSTPIASSHDESDAIFHIHEFSIEELKDLAKEYGFSILLFGQGKRGPSDSRLFARVVRLIPRNVKRWQILKTAQSLSFSVTDARRGFTPESRVTSPLNPSSNTDVIFVMLPVVD
jgi:SAM-dependent methyltransferase